MNILISACLLGVNCRYDGSGSYMDGLEELMKKHNLIPVCPEIFGGMCTPRDPAEISKNRVISKLGEDVTPFYIKGADEVLKLARLYQCNYAILKERSPSCGFGKIYDGTFTGTLVDGNGYTAELLTANGINVIGESQIKTNL